MNTKIVEFLFSYGFSTFIIAVIASILDYIAEKTFFKNAPRFIKNFAPFFVTILLMIAFDMFFVYNSFIFQLDSLYKGVISGSISTIISVICKKIASGEKITDSPIALLIEGLLEGYVLDENKGYVVDKIVKIIEKGKCDDLENKTITEQITCIIKQYSKTILTEKDLNEIVKIIFDTIK